MKILYVIPYFTPKLGGEANCCFHVAKMMAEKGHDVTIATTDYENDNTYDKILQNVSIKRFKCKLDLSFFLYSPNFKAWIGDNIERFDLCHIHTFRSYQNIVVQKAATSCGVPYILQAHGTVLRLYQKKSLKFVYDKLWGNAILKNASGLIALTELELKQYVQMGADKSKISIIPNGVVVPRLDYTKRMMFKKKHGIPLDAKMILYMGRMHKIKGIEFLIESFSILKKRYPSSVLVLIGPNHGYADEMRELIEEYGLDNSVYYLGPIYDDDRFYAYLDADVYVQPSIYDGFPTTVLEAITCGNPIVLTNGCGCAKFVEENDIGIAINYGDTDGFCEALLSIILNQKKATSMSENGKGYAEEYLSLRIQADHLERLYLDILKQNG